DPGVVPGDGQVINLDRIVRQTAYGGGRLAHGDLFQNGIVEFQIEFCHCGPPDPNLRRIFLYHGRSTILSSRHVMLSSPPRSLAAGMSRLHPSSRLRQPLIIVRISSSRRCRVSPSDVINSVSPGMATRSSTSASTSTSAPKARRITFCSSDLSACSCVI